MGDFMDRLVWITAIVLAICVLTSCGGKPEQAAGEAAIEKAIEASAAAEGKDVDVDLKGGSMTVKSSDGKATIVTGENVEIPSDFPKDVPVYQGAKIQMALKEAGHTLRLTSSDSVDKITEYYKKEVAGQGWTEDTVVSQGNPQPMSMLGYKKDKRILSIVITKEEDGTGVTLTSVSE